ncbi:MAG: hypothetical protein COV99_05900 [Bacteroidetes bacterium CG12_big_fil_rev_8_21_14_0_65_60_17]|nr:MAG: hypothetical protein COV99_05900 [Bacteroidetes bacterium CG12_big_fil_rev_8_21_14_0_65_60_17]
MKKEPEDIVQTTYAAAQLVADDLDEAARLVERVFTAPQPATTQEALHRLSTLASGMSARRTGLLADRLLRERLDDVVERALVALPAERRLAVYNAFLHADEENPERTVFLYAVERGMDQGGSPPVSSNLVAEALGRTVTRNAEKVPPELRDAVATRLTSSNTVEETSATPRRAAFRFVTAVAVIVAASFLGMWLGRPAPVPDAPGQESKNLLDLLEESLERAGTPIFSGGSTEQAETMLQERFLIRASVPRLDGATLDALWSTRVAGIDIPALTYADDGGHAVHMFIVSYDLLNANRRVLPFPTDILNQIAAPDGVDIITGDTTSRVIWRHRDDVYIAYTRGDALSLHPRLTY